MKNNNTYITYDQLLSYILNYIRMTGGEDLLNEGDLNIIINLSIQDLLNTSEHSFMQEFEVVKAEEDSTGTYSIFKTKQPIDFVHEITKEGSGPNLAKNIVNRMPYINSQEFYFKKGTNILYGNKGMSHITISYNKAYEFHDFNNKEARTKKIPFPFSYVPALIKMIYDNVSIYTFFQGDGKNTDFWGHGRSRVLDLEEHDKLTTAEEINIEL